MSVLEHAQPNPHMYSGGYFSDDNWIDCDVPALARAAARAWLRQRVLDDADAVIRRAEAEAAALRHDAAALS